MWRVRDGTVTERVADSASADTAAVVNLAVGSSVRDILMVTALMQRFEDAVVFHGTETSDVEV